jgi:oxygen-independent coproporphyrinogen-3 oxidase
VTDSQAGGIYVHFPFCVHRCFYCDFNLITPQIIPQRRYTDAILRELNMRAPMLNGEAQSLYFGGGTPSLWEPELMAEVIAEAREAPGLLPHAEVTLEANPSDIDPSRCKQWLDIGINRLSLGAQSFDTKTLKAADRQHTGEDSLRAVKIAREAGFKRLSVDLMFGLPGQTESDWERELEQVIELRPTHISVYGLTVEEATPLHRVVKTGAIVLPEDEHAHRMFFRAHDLLGEIGYVHYEVSAYGLPGHRAVHNGAYWDWRPYLGLGAGAHGFDGVLRWENIRRVKKYMTQTLEGFVPSATSESLDEESRAFERLMVGLRRLDRGIELRGECARFQSKAEALVERGWLEQHEGAVRVTREGLRWMNDVLSEFL